MAESGIYEIVNLVNGKRYVGSAVKFRVRWRQHKRLLNRGEHYSPAMQRAWLKYGSDAFEFRVIKVCDREQLLAEEQAELDRQWPEYNNCPTAGSSLGRVLSEKTRAKISASKTGSKMPPRSAEHRKALSASSAWKEKGPPEHVVQALQAGRRRKVWADEDNAARSEGMKRAYAEGRKSRERSPEYRAKIAESLRGRKLTQEHRAAVSASMQGKKRGPYNLSAEEIKARRERAKKNAAMMNARRWGKPLPD